MGLYLELAKQALRYHDTPGDRLGQFEETSVGCASMPHKPSISPAISPDDLPGDWRVDWEERAAIMEYDGGMPRERAEAMALNEIIQQMSDVERRNERERSDGE